MKQVARERDDYKKRFLQQKQEVAKYKHMHEASERIRQN